MNVIWLGARIKAEELAAGRLDSPWGAMFSLWHGDALVRLVFADSTQRLEQELACTTRSWRESPEWLEAGEPRLRQLGDVLADWPEPGDRHLPPLEMIGTAFQRNVWQVLLRLRLGQTMTYGDIAARLGKAGAARAVGRAVGANPVAVLVPCHRVLPGAGGSGQYAGGAERKRWLLRREGIIR
mgnify:CR=1 FL=1